MTEAVRRAGVPVALMVLLVLAIAVPVDVGLEGAESDSESARRLVGVLDGLPPAATVLVGFDPDVGTYAEIRPTVRAVLDDLLERGSELALVSLSAEGRALAVEERRRLEGSGPPRLVDLGFAPGAEAALVDIARAMSGSEPVASNSSSVDLASVELVVIVGGNDIGPRSWVEQVVPRVGSLPVIAITPTILLPEVAPYVATGQLAAAVVNPREGAALRAELGSSEEGPPAAAMLVGLLAAIALLGEGLARRAVRRVRARPGKEAIG